MLFELSPKSTELQKQLKAFMDKHVYPNEEEYYRQLNQGGRWDIIPLIETLKQRVMSMSSMDANGGHQVPGIHAAKFSFSWARLTRMARPISNSL